MKQLKFMLAAATAISLATAAQADTETTLVDDQFATEALPAGYSYVPASENDNDNESAVVSGGYESDYALKVNTGTNPLLRHMNYNAGTAIDMTDSEFKSLYIDTMVQFTVTPYADKDNVTTNADDKLMIYLLEVPEVKAEDGSVTTPASTELMVKASKIVTTAAGGIGGGVKTSYEPTTVAVNNYTAAPGVWYRLRVESSLNAAGCVVFTIKLKNPSVDADFVTLTNAESLDPNNSALFPSLMDTRDKTLTYVGFAGEGTIDDLKVVTITEPTSVDFTFTLGENVSAVSWTVGGVEQDDLTYSAAAGSTYDVVIKSVTYAPGYAGSKVWAGWTSNVTASTTVTIDGAEKFADVTKDNEGNVTAVIPNETTVTSVTTGSFQVPTDDNEAAVAAAKAELGKVLTWATSVGRKSYDQAIAAVNKMNFDKDGNPAVVGEDDDVADEEAFLLNCAPAELAAAKEAFSFPSFTPGEIPQATEGDFNGKVTLKGATALGSWFDVIKEQGDNYGKIFNGKTYEVPSFFKSVLTLK